MLSSFGTNIKWKQYKSQKVADLQFDEQEAFSCSDKNILAEWEQYNSNCLNESSIITVITKLRYSNVNVSWLSYI